MTKSKAKRKARMWKGWAILYHGNSRVFEISDLVFCVKRPKSKYYEDDQHIQVEIKEVIKPRRRKVK